MSKKENMQVNIDIIGNIAQFSKSIDDIQRQLERLSLSPKLVDSFKGIFIDLREEIKTISQITEKGFITPIDEKQFHKSIDIISNSYLALFKKLESHGVSTAFLVEDKKALDQLTKAQKAYTKAVGETQKKEKDLDKAKKEVESAGRAKQKGDEAVDELREKKKQLEAEIRQLKKDKKTAEENVEKTGKVADKRLQKEEADATKHGKKPRWTERDSPNFSRTTEGGKYKKAVGAVETIQKRIESLQEQVKGSTEEIKAATVQAKELDTVFKQAKEDEKKISDIPTISGSEAIKKTLQELKDFDWSSVGIDIEKIQSIEDLNNAYASFSETAKTKVVSALEGIDNSAQEASEGVRTIKGAADVAGQGLDELTRREQELNHLKDELYGFFSIGNAVQLFKRAVSSAFETVKELDATMTEAAVVTDFSISDMWDKLPQYASDANKLGVSINGLYGATTLYYQQGLKSNEAMGVGIETMKMARIANMQAEEATKAMTAALRGFNMEVNEVNAQKVNDVYSELAAITAADTSQIAEAMSKTASIASSANMEFETTAALLAQIIETTQEAPQTAGTALKTIIARFTEIKTLLTEGQLTGTDAEGEVIEINKIDTALKTVGISLADFLNGTKGIDDIFLELASKWDTLDLATQRYIATTAAGSRQQSRFLAMMSDYDRTMELVNAANNSAGASQEQFNKTLESLESKLTKLKNAWDTFAMSLANNDILKLGVDALTGFLNIVNKLIDGLSGGNGLVKSVLSLSAAIGGLKLGKTILKKGLGNVSDIWNKREKSEIGEPKKERKITIERQPKDKDPKDIFDPLEQYEQKKEQAKKVFDSRVAKEGSIIALDPKINQEYETLIAELHELEQAQQSLDFSTLQTLKTQVEAKKITEEQIALMGEEIAKKYAKAVVDKDEITQQKILNQLNLEEQAIQNGGIKGLLTEIGLVVTKRANIKGETVDLTELIAAKWANVKATLAMNKTALIGLGAIAGVTVAIGAIVGVTVALTNWAKNSTMEAKAEKLHKEIDDLNAALENTKTNIESITQAADGLSTLENEFKDLTKGSDEWNKKLLEINQQVLELIDKYPSLQEYIDTGLNGELIIKSEGFNKLIQQQQESASSIYTAQTAKTLESDQLNRLMSYKDERYGLQNYNEDALVDYEKLLTEAAKQGLYLSQGATRDQFKELFVEMQNQGIFGKYDDFDSKWATIQRIGTKADEIGQYGLAGQAADKAKIDAAVQQVASTTSGIINSQFTDVAQNLASQRYNSLDNKIKDEISSIKINKEILKEYQAITGISSDKLQEKRDKNEITDETIKSVVAASRVNSQMTNEMENTIKVLHQLQTSLGETNKDFNTFSRVLQKDGLGLKQSDLDNLFTGYSDKDFEEQRTLISNDGQIEDFLNRIGFTEADAQLLGFDTLADYVDFFQQNILNAAEALENIYANSFDSEKIKENTSNLGTTWDLDIGQMQSIAKTLSNITLAGGDIDSFTTTIQDMVSGIANSEDRLKAINLITSTDWTNTNSIDNTIDALKHLGLAIDNELTNKLYDVTAAIYKVNLEDLENKLTDLEGNIKQIKEKIKDDDSTFSKEEKDSLVTQGILSDNFVQLGMDEYVYLGNMTNLLTSLDTNVAQILETARTELNEAVSKGEQISEYSQQTPEGGYKFGDDVYNNVADLILALKNGAATVDNNDTNQLNLLQEIARGFGFDQSSLDSYNAEHLAAALINQFESYVGEGNMVLQDNQAKLQEFNTRDLQYSYTQQGSGQDILNTRANTEEENKAKSDVLQGKALQAGEEQIEHVTKSLEKYNSTLAKNSNLINAHVSDIYDDNKAQGELNKAISDNIEALNDSNKESYAYVNALHKVHKAAKDVFGDDITEDFVEDNIELFKQLDEGGKIAEEAFAKLSQAAAQAYVESLNNGINFSDALIAVMSNIPTDIEIGATFDATQAIQALLDLGFEADQVAQIMEKLGYTVDFIYEDHQIGDITGMDYGPNPIRPGEPTYTQKVLKSAVATPKSPSGFAPSKPKSSKGGGGRKGGGGKEEKPEIWENPYDEFYNLTEKINEALRQREKLEREYDRLLKNRKATSKDLMNNSLAQITSLRKEIDYQKQLQTARERQIAELGSQKHADKDGNLKSFSSWGVTQYGSYNANTGTISIDWDAINKITDEEKGGAVEAYISKLEELSGQFEETQDTIEDMEDQIKEIKEQNKDGYLELEQRIYDALVAREQSVIDEYQKLSDTIGNSNSEILNSLRESIDLERQIEQNTKTEEDINEKEARLAYLKRDTSGAFDTEILQLEKELEDAREDYGNTLIDQEVSRLDKENQKAAEQRNQQIEIMQAQLDYAAKSGDFWAETYSLIASAVGPDGHLANNSPLVELLQSTEAFKGMSEIGQFNWIGELVNEFNAAKQGEANWRLDMAEQAGSAKLSDDTSVTYDAKTDSWVDSAGNVYKDLSYNSDTGYFDYGSKTAPTSPSSGSSGGAAPAGPSFPYGKASDTSGNIKYSRRNGGNAVRAIQYALNQLGYGNSGTAKVDGYFGSGTRAAVKAFQAANGISADGIVGKNTREKFRMHGYKTGGLADYTGPAWLDGTKTHPELVLNAKDTENFIALKDILSKALTGKTSTGQSSGDNYYEIHINVDEIGSDYDVDQLTERIKEKINEDASYRNVNAINFLR